MQSIDAFFAHKAKTFTQGDMVQACASLALPTTIYFGDQVMFIKNFDQLTQMIGVYYDRLRAKGHAQTVCTILSRSDLKEGAVRATVRWTHLDAANTIIKSVEITYFCKTQNNAWQIGLVEVATQPDKVLMAGIPRN